MHRFSDPMRESANLDATGLKSHWVDSYWRLYRKQLRACRKYPRRSHVHDLRTTLRRLVASLDLIEKLVDLKKAIKLRKEFKIQIRLLSALRDDQVQEKTLNPKRKEPGIACFMTFIHSKRKVKEKLVQRKLQKIHVRRLYKRFKALGAQLMKYLQNPQRLQKANRRWTQILNNELIKLKSTMESAKPEDLASFHAARIQARKIRYLIDLIEIYVPISKSLKSKLKQLQNVLGETQDTVVMVNSLINFLIVQRKTNHDSSLLTFLRIEELKQEQSISYFLKNKINLLNTLQP